MCVVSTATELQI